MGSEILDYGPANDIRTTTDNVPITYSISWSPGSGGSSSVGGFLNIPLAKTWAHVWFNPATRRMYHFSFIFADFNLLPQGTAGNVEGAVEYRVPQWGFPAGMKHDIEVNTKCNPTILPSC